MGEGVCFPSPLPLLLPPPSRSFASPLSSVFSLSLLRFSKSGFFGLPLSLIRSVSVYAALFNRLHPSRHLFPSLPLHLCVCRLYVFLAYSLSFFRCVLLLRSPRLCARFVVDPSLSLSSSLPLPLHCHHFTPALLFSSPRPRFPHLSSPLFLDESEECEYPLLRGAARRKEEARGKRKP